MEQTVQITRLLVQFQEGFLVEVVFVGGLGTEDHAHAGLELLLGDAGLQSVQVEGVADELLVEFDHELVALERAEPLDPAHEGGTSLVGELTVYLVLLLVGLRVIVLLLLLLLSHHHKLLLLLHLRLLVSVLGFHLN
jgi:hypothetical protein